MTTTPTLLLLCHVRQEVGHQLLLILPAPANVLHDHILDSDNCHGFNSCNLGASCGTIIIILLSDSVNSYHIHSSIISHTECSLGVGAVAKGG